MTDVSTHTPHYVPRPRATRGLRSPLGILALVLVVLILGVAIFCGLIAPYDPNKQDYNAFLEGPSVAHWLGTDHLGRDLLSRLMYGSRVALMVGFGAVGFAMVCGVTLGLLAGYSRGFLDDAIMRVVDAILAFPSVMLALGIMAALGPGLTTIIIAIGIADMPLFARLTRSQVLSVRERDFVTAALAMGARAPRIILRHILPHILGPVIALATLQVGHAILIEAVLSFLGLGVQPPTASWGAILKSGFDYLELAPWISAFSGLAILLTVLGITLLEDALREQMDPKSGAKT